MICNKCGTTYITSPNYCMNCGKKLKKHPLIIWGIPRKSWAERLSQTLLTEYKWYAILTAALVFLFCGGIAAGFLADHAKLPVAGLILSIISFVMYTLGSIGLLCWILFKAFILLKLWQIPGDIKFISPHLVVILTLMPVIGTIWHYAAYPGWCFIHKEKKYRIPFIIYSLLSTLLLVPGINFYALFLFVIADFIIYKMIYTILSNTRGK